MGLAVLAPAVAAQAAQPQGMQWILLGVSGGLGETDSTAAIPQYKSLGVQFDGCFSLLDYFLEGNAIPRLRFGDLLLIRAGVDLSDGVR